VTSTILLHRIVAITPQTSVYLDLELKYLPPSGGLCLPLTLFWISDALPNNFKDLLNPTYETYFNAMLHPNQPPQEYVVHTQILKALDLAIDSHSAISDVGSQANKNGISLEQSIAAMPPNTFQTLYLMIEKKGVQKAHLMGVKKGEYEQYWVFDSLDFREIPPYEHKKQGLPATLDLIHNCLDRASKNATKLFLIAAQLHCTDPAYND